jgi:16S rRNA (guanine966-N2)-methyltransferase
MQRRREKTTVGPPSSARKLRIVAGEWRGRRWQFVAAPGVRPTPDRVRETLFNWLAPTIAGARCLDLFAGSGALGLEALSRGAKEVVFVDHDQAVLKRLQELLTAWQAARYRLERLDAQVWLKETRPAERFDVVFLDPPFAARWGAELLRSLVAGDWLATGAQVYLEMSAADPLPALPPGWSARRSGHAGAVSYHLLHETPRAVPGNL